MADKNEDKKTTGTAVAAAEAPDLAQFDELSKQQEAGVDVTIKDPAGRAMGFSIKVAGPDSERQRNALEIIRKERLATIENLDEPTAEELARLQMRALAMSVISWTPFRLDGAVYEYSAESAAKLFNRFPWIREQVEAKAGSRRAFFPRSSPPSDGGTESI